MRSGGKRVTSGSMKFPRERCSHWRTFVAGFAVALAFSLCSTVHAQDEESGLFEIVQTELTLREGTYFLDATARLELSAEARDALASGLPLSISYRLEFLNRLRLWWDIEQLTVVESFQIEYHALTERYIVTNAGTGASARFVSLSAALADVGRIEGLRTVSVAELDDDLRYDVRLRVVLDTERLPGPLRLIAFWRRDWSLASEWQTWRLDEE